MKNITKIGLVIVILVLLATSTSLFVSNKNTKELSVRLSWLINSNQAGFITAVDKGFYQEEGLNVTNNPGGTNFPAIQLVASGSDDIGIQSGPETIISARANNIPIKAIAVLDRKNPYVFYSLTKKNITSPKDWEGKTVGVSYGRPLEIAYRMLLKIDNVDSSKITEVQKNPSDLNLYQGSVDVQPNFITDFIISNETASKQNISLSLIRASDYGIKSYGYTIFTTDEMIKEHPDIVEKYLRATLKGWDYALNHPEEAINFVIAENPQLEKQPELKALEARKDYILPNDSDVPMGWIDEKVFQEVYDNMLKTGQLDKQVNISETFTNEFIEKISKE
ncbi:MAG: ABC transporter substrate-binding protein [Nanoarchaeota archaeon]|nr:ABC transporter substrate-binding protein [Nanoarchaeota archaeon]